MQCLTVQFPVGALKVKSRSKICVCIFIPSRQAGILSKEPYQTPKGFIISELNMN